MNLAIIGHGKMGRLIEQLAPEYGFTVTQRLNSTNNRDATGITGNKFAGIDVAVDFSTADAAPHNIARLAALQINTIVGTTGWTQHLLQVQARVRDSGIGLVWSPNYSVGVNIFLQLASEASRRIASYKEYGAWAWEIHHAAKKDAPSGTLAESSGRNEARRSRKGSLRQLQSRRRPSRHARNRFRFRCRLAHDPPHSPQPRRLRPRRPNGRPLGRRQTRLVRIPRRVVRPRFNVAPAHSFGRPPLTLPLLLTLSLRLTL